jgi:hypothetical protein
VSAGDTGHTHSTSHEEKENSMKRSANRQSPGRGCGPGTRRGLSVTLLAVLGLVLGAAATPAAAAERVDPKAMSLLKSMCDFVAALPAFTVRAVNESEVILVDGQKLDYSTVSQVTLKRPNRLRAHRVDSQDEADLVYDGKSVTLHFKATNFYASEAVPGSLDGALDLLRDSLTLDLPGADLLYTDAFDGLTWDVTDAQYVGRESLGDVPVHHLAFRTPSIDFQVWVQDADKPLPRKYVITTKWLTGAPQNGVELTDWNLAPRIDDSAFTFTPPAGARKIDFLRAGSMVSPR